MCSQLRSIRREKVGSFKQHWMIMMMMMIVEVMYSMMMVIKFDCWWWIYTHGDRTSGIRGYLEVAGIIGKGVGNLRPEGPKWDWGSWGGGSNPSPPARGSPSEFRLILLLFLGAQDGFSCYI